MLQVMLAGKAELDKLRYPLMASPKLDGIRAVVLDGVVLSRSMKPIPNEFIQSRLGGTKVLEGLDGELIVGGETGENVYNRTSSAVMSVDGCPIFTFRVFDDLTAKDLAFYNRYVQLAHRIKRLPAIPARHVFAVGHVDLPDERHLLEYEDFQVRMGYEGIMLRDPMGPYKHGRSTLKEGWLLKLKRFEDSEAVIEDTVELQSNQNEAKRNVLGHLERSSHKAGMVGKGVLGALVVRDLQTKVSFEIGTGFTAEQRDELWRKRKSLKGLVVKYKFLPYGVLVKPRHPVFLGFRDAIDL